MSTFIPVTPAGTFCMWLESDTEDEAWSKLLVDAAHMPYKTKENFVSRGYTVRELYSRCDFCSEEAQELKRYEPLKPVSSVEAGGVKAEIEDIGPWCACKTCVELIEADRWKELAERAMVPLRRHVPDVSDEYHLEAVKSMWTVVFGERVKL